MLLVLTVAFRHSSAENKRNYAKGNIFFYNICVHMKQNEYMLYICYSHLFHAENNKRKMWEYLLGKRSIGLTGKKKIIQYLKIIIIQLLKK